MANVRRSSDFLAIALSLISAPALSESIKYKLDSVLFSAEEAVNVCRKKGSGWGTVDAEDPGPRQAKIDLPKEVFVSVTEGDNMFVVVADTNSWKNRDPKPGEKFGVLCEYSSNFAHGVSEGVPPKQNIDDSKEHEEKLLHRAEKFFNEINGKNCQRALIIAGYETTFSDFDGLHCLPSKIWKQAMEGPKWQVGNVKTGGWSTLVTPDNQICESAIPVYKKQALAAVKAKLTVLPVKNGVQTTVIDQKFWDQVEKAAGRSCTQAEELTWEADRQRKIDEFHFRRHK